ncbi:MAG: polyprenyl synthetase family protein [Chloroflexota bacterium]|nr:polyprenyl synthetase family protein [Chloroflexota bacterium]
MTATVAPLPARPSLQVAVSEQAERLLDAAPMTPAYRAALIAALHFPGNILSEAPDARWARLVWTCCTAAGGDERQAVRVAAAVELFMVALDVLDDAEDGEESALQAELGAACALNVSTGLLFVAQQGLLAAGNGGDDAVLARLLLEAGLHACAGQHADLTGVSERPVGLDDALAVTAGKSASLAAAICQLGAARAGADSATQRLFARFGWYLGMIAQLINDLKGVQPDAVGKTDIALGRPTLPLAHATQLAPTVEAEPIVRATVWTDGPAQLTWAVAETYRSRALALIPHVTADHANRAALAALLPCL